MTRRRVFSDSLFRVIFFVDWRSPLDHCLVIFTKIKYKELNPDKIVKSF